MYILYSDEAGSQEKWLQAISTILLTKEQIPLFDDLSIQRQTHELKFSRVRTSDSYTQELIDFLVSSIELIWVIESQLVVLIGSSHDSLYADMYEEVFLIAQWYTNGEFAFHPDQKNMMKRYDRASSLKDEFWMTYIQEMDSSTSVLTQTMDIIAWLTIWLREHHGTYRAWKESWDRYQRLGKFDRELHMRCEVVDAFFDALKKEWCEVWVSEEWIWYGEDERVMVLEY